MFLKCSRKIFSDEAVLAVGYVKGNLHIFQSLCCPHCKKSLKEDGLVMTTAVHYSAPGLLFSFGVKKSVMPRSAVLLLLYECRNIHNIFLHTFLDIYICMYFVENL